MTETSVFDMDQRERRQVGDGVALRVHLDGIAGRDDRRHHFRKGITETNAAKVCLVVT